VGNLEPINTAWNSVPRNVIKFKELETPWRIPKDLFKTANLELPLPSFSILCRSNMTEVTQGSIRKRFVKLANNATTRTIIWKTESSVKLVPGLTNNLL